MDMFLVAAFDSNALNSELVHAGILDTSDPIFRELDGLDGALKKSSFNDTFLPFILIEPCPDKINKVLNRLSNTGPRPPK